MAEAAPAMHRACGRSAARSLGRRRAVRRAARVLVLTLAVIPCTAAKLVDVRSARHRDFTRIVFETDEKVSYAIENRSLGSERAIELTIPAIAQETILRAVHEPAVSVQVEASETGSRALVRVSGPVDVWTNQLGDPPRVVLDLRVAEPVAERDPEELDALDYQIVVEADPAASGRDSSVAPDGETTRVPPSPPDALEGGDPFPRLRSAPTGWASAARLWWALAALGVAFVAVLWVQRINQRRRRAQRVTPPAAPLRSRPPPPAPEASARPPSAPPPPRPPSATQAPGTPPAGAGEARAPERAEAVEASPPAAGTPAAAPPPPATPQRAELGPTQELFELLSRMDERLAVLERELRDTRAESRELRERSAAQAEELRAQRVAVARLLRRPIRSGPQSAVVSGARSSSSS